MVDIAAMDKIAPDNLLSVLGFTFKIVEVDAIADCFLAKVSGSKSNQIIVWLTALSD